MAEYINRNKLNELIDREIEVCNSGMIRGALEYLKAVVPIAADVADVEEVIHAHWEAVEREAFWLSDSDIWMKSGKPTKHLMPVCSHCKTEFGKIVLDYKRCPECGAKMDGE